ncbi:SWIM zinc finger family protein [Pengzhenrongella sp.]|jgi:uncharacterized Zn finger protein|uniref:SWIM zinc finger family protein n=1 Tax=Pengzhenrongella sp. TaxID=2888820 RepID=UPI002F9349C7
MSPQWSGGFPPASKPIRVAGGLVARSTRGDIGEQWWSRRFVQVLESFALGGRLTRGKNYARRGQVLSLDVVAGKVSATVQGSRRAPYRVTIGLAPFSALVWARVEVELASQAIHSARLLAGELPPELEDVFVAAGAPLFPTSAADLTMACSCPDQVVPCKHISAAIYLLAESLDDDPFRLLHWRGRDRAALLSRLRELRNDAPASAVPAVSATPAAADQADPRRDVGAATALADLAGTDRPTDPAGFWTARPLPPLPSHPELPRDLVLRQLPVPAAELGGAALVNDLRALYLRLASSQE